MSARAERLRAAATHLAEGRSEAAAALLDDILAAEPDNAAA
ncbi:MAG: co-chaperone YbbN, partial [Alphaproteobacteria bacterium]|nr:co-chaperone YbbN [Alphaproteobacteria bacterium]